MSHILVESNISKRVRDISNIADRECRDTMHVGFNQLVFYSFLFVIVAELARVYLF